MQWVAGALIAFGLLVGVVVLYDRREARAELRHIETVIRHDEVVGRLMGDLERARRENTTLLRQVAGIDPTPEQQRADLMAQLGHGPGTTTAAARENNTVGAGPLPAQPTRWEMPPDDYYDDPTDLTAPLDDPAAWAGIEAPELAWANQDEPLAAPEPVPESEYRPIIMGMGLDENPLEELGITPAWRDDGAS